MLLNGISVIECSQVLSAPYAGMILADLCLLYTSDAADE